jgi:hypothetical protein
MANLYDMYYAQAMNHKLAKDNNPDANLWSERVSQCFKRDSLLCRYYNKDMSGGKWDGMMTQKHIGYRSWNDNFRADMLPQTTTVAATDKQGGYTFSPTLSAAAPASTVSGASAANGFVSMEAEHYYSATAADGTQWTVYPYYGRTRSAVALTPYQQPVGGAKLNYRFSLPDGTNKVKVYVITKSTLDFLNVGGFEYAVSMDGGEQQVVNFNKTLVDRQPYMYSEFYPAVARRIVEKTVELPVKADGNTTADNKDGMHVLTLQPRHPGIVFEKIVVDFGGYQPSYLFGEESPCKRE